MARSRQSPERIIGKRREAEAVKASGGSIADAGTRVPEGFLDPPRIPQPSSCHFRRSADDFW